MIFNYIKKVLSKWWILLGIAPEIIDRISIYYEEIPKLPAEIYYGVILLSLLISTYFVWREEKLKNIELGEKYKNPIDYEITAEIHPFDDEVETSIKRLEEDIGEGQKEIDKIIIPKKEANTNQLINPEIHQNIINIELIQQQIKSQLTMIGSLENDNIDSRSYEERLESYKSSLQSYINKMKKYIEEMKIFYNEREGKIFYVFFKIHNIGTAFDEHIEIEITSNKSIFSEYDNFGNHPKFPQKPEEPKKEIEYKQNVFLNPLSNFNDPLKGFNTTLMNLSDMNPESLRRFVEINDNRISVLFRDLKAGVKKDIFKDGLYIKSEDLNDLSIEIQSKNSIKMNKKIRIIKKESLTFSDIWNKKEKI